MLNKIHGQLNLNVLKIVIAALLLISSNSFAQDAFKPKVYFGFEAGNLNLPNANPIYKKITGNSKNIDLLQNTFYGRLFLGYKINENLDVEIGYAHALEDSYESKLTKLTPNSVEIYKERFTRQVNRIDSSLLIHPLISTGLNGAFVRVGGYVTQISYHTDIQAQSVNYELLSSKHKYDNGLILGLGYDFNISNSFDFRVQAAKQIGTLSRIKDTSLSLALLVKF